MYLCITICNICPLGLVCLRYGTYMFKDMIGIAQVKADRVLIAAKLSLLWHVTTAVIYIGKNEIWKYAFAISLFLNIFALLRASGIVKSQTSNQRFEKDSMSQRVDILKWCKKCYMRGIY